MRNWVQKTCAIEAQEELPLLGGSLPYLSNTASGKLRVSSFWRDHEKEEKNVLILLQFSSLQSLSCVRLVMTPWSTACQASLSITNSRSLLKLMSIELWYHPTIWSSVVPFSCPQSFPASGSFLMGWLFASGGQSIGASASGLPMNIQDWFLLGWTG